MRTKGHSRIPNCRVMSSAMIPSINAYVLASQQLRASSVWTSILPSNPFKSIHELNAQVNPCYSHEKKKNEFETLQLLSEEWNVQLHLAFRLIFFRIAHVFCEAWTFFFQVPTTLIKYALCERILKFSSKQSLSFFTPSSTCCAGLRQRANDEPNVSPNQIENKNISLHQTHCLNLIRFFFSVNDVLRVKKNPETLADLECNFCDIFSVACRLYVLHISAFIFLWASTNLHECALSLKIVEVEWERDRKANWYCIWSDSINCKRWMMENCVKVFPRLNWYIALSAA